ncbi:MAG: response regulator [Pseudomonadota bacterium]
MISILLVEDNPQKIEQTASAIKSAKGSHDLKIAMNVRDAKSALEQQRFDLLLLDINLPKTPDASPVADGGLEVLRWLKARGSVYRPQYIVGITAFDESFEKAQSEFNNLIWRVISVRLGHNQWQEQLQETVDVIGAQIRPPFVGDGASFKTDVLVVTALADPELSAILESLGGLEKVSVAHDASIYFRGRIVNDRKAASLAVVAASDKGLAGAAIAATKGIYSLWPRHVFMTGITAGLKGRTKIGDVIFADPSWDWGSGKIKKVKGREEFLPAPYQRRLDETFVRQAKELSDDKKFLSKIWQECKLAKPDNAPKIHVGAMASGGSVLQSHAAVKRVVRQHKDLLAIEMEAFSVMFACQAAPEPRPMPIVAKAVCDFGDGGKNDKYQKYAAYVSAEVFKEYARRYLLQRTN